MTGRWVMSDGLAAWRNTHTQGCHDACPGHTQPPRMDEETWVLYPCVCSCHYPLTQTDGQ